MVLRDPANIPGEGAQLVTRFLPSLYQGTVVRAREPRVLNLNPPAELQGKPQENFLEFLSQLNSGTPVSLN